MSEHKGKKVRSLVGIAQEEAREIELDFCTLDYVISPANRNGLRQKPEGGLLDDEDEPGIAAAASRVLITHIVEERAFASRGPGDPGGMKPSDRKMWAVWQTALDGSPVTVKLPKNYVTWLIHTMRADDLRVPGSLAQWFETLVSYLEDAVLTKDTPAS